MKKYLIIKYESDFFEIKIFDYIFNEEKYKVINYKNLSLYDLNQFDKIVAIIDIPYLNNHKTMDFSHIDLIVCYFPDPLWDRLNYSLEIFKSDFNIKKDNILILSGAFFLKDNPNHETFYFIFNQGIIHNRPINYDFKNSRPFLFDALLGNKRVHKMELFKRLESSNLLEKSLVSIKDTIYFKDNTVRNYESPELNALEDEYVIKFKNKNNTSETFAAGFSIEETASNDLYGSTIPMFAKISHKIYQNSWFSLVTETIFDHNIFNRGYFNFITEKTSKCLFSKRIFICFSNYWTLKKLKSLGFKTFDGIIDESYDLEENHDKRFNMAWSQVEWLSKQDPIKLYEQAIPVLEHNFKLVKNFNTGNDIIKSKIESFLNK